MLYERYLRASATCFQAYNGSHYQKTRISQYFLPSTRRSYSQPRPGCIIARNYRRCEFTYLFLIDFAAAHVGIIGIK